MTVSKRRAWRPALFLRLVAAIAAATFILPVSAQEAADTLVGRVVLEGRPVAGAPVVLHRVTSDASGEVASSVTNAQGAFRFPLEQVEGVAFNVYFVTAEHLAVRYFGRPIHPTEAAADYAVTVFDTTSVLPEPLRVTRRDVVMIPERSGSWEVNEVVRIRNSSDLALVGAGGGASWEFRIPPGAIDFEAGEGDIFPHEISRMDDRVLLLTPVTPGERDLYIRYRMPARPGSVDLPVEQPTDTLNLFVRQPSHLSGVVGLSTTRMIDAEGEQFLQYGGTDLLPGSHIGLQWRRSGSPIDPVIAAVAVTLLLLAAGVGAAVRNRRSRPA